MATHKTGYWVGVTCSTNMKLVLRLCSVERHFIPITDVQLVSFGVVMD